MSAVIGSCTDCVTASPRTPINTLNTTVKVTLGKNLVTRQVGLIPTSFDATLGAVAQDFSLGGGKSIILSRGAAALVLQVSAPVTVTTTKSINNGQSTLVNTLTVNGVLLLDDTYINVVIANPNASGSEAITGQLVHVPAV